MQEIVKAVPLLCFLLLGCDPAEKEAPRGSGKSSYVAANLLGYNHMAGTNINWFSVNGYRGHAGGFTCCISLPEKWRPNMQVAVEWEVNPNPFPKDLPHFDDPNYKHYMEKYKATFRQYKAVATIPEYEDSCGLQVHFLPCQQIKVTATCHGPTHPDHPIKEPFDLPEPGQCPPETP
ncbi:DUF3304 domain-containing protein [Klebsiella oxytoca]|jgi:hypothetical protein|nr:DUF3304 domain-containing protein [Klebsiella oxytoca]ELT8148367.1 DUF3304 domain-containing protein [Klebsiella oxytoca]ELT9465608.1 DUF3304 domain-containing protein [Klebsiella oxytoca]EME8415370.1 DUF3304 domain-containing protein [Klebsiella oxytoca]MBZ6802319.1 DUF3304 domain-containing protein [Klebsiella oxytoca]MBZ7197706.1 DUF3304 domain-containing protein [Klebsiella oxytoca]